MLKFISTINMNQIQNKGQMSAKSFFPRQEGELITTKIHEINQNKQTKTK